jgi:glycosyltransferase involved in cell wall biosynthesis
MRLIFAAADLLGYGGIQYCNRLAVQALREAFGPSVMVHVLSRMDATSALAAAVGPPCYGAEGSRLKMGAKMLQLVNGGDCAALLLMHVNMAPVLPLCIRRVPTLAMLYGIDAWRPLGWARRRGLQRATRLVSISEHTRRLAEEFNPWMKDLPHGICYLGIPTADHPSPGIPIPPEGSPYALTIGRMAGADRYKGFDELIRVWPRLQELRPGFKLVLIGDGPDRCRLEAQARQMGANTEFLGRVSDDDRDRFLRHCTCFCMPSRSEGFGLVYLEAMRLGKPVLAGSADAGSEVVLDGLTGRTVDPTNSEKLLAALLDITSPDSAKYGQAGLQRFLDHFTYNHFRDRFVEEVGNILK